MGEEGPAEMGHPIRSGCVGCKTCIRAFSSTSSPQQSRSRKGSPPPLLVNERRVARTIVPESFGQMLLLPPREAKESAEAEQGIRP